MPAAPNMAVFKDGAEVKKVAGADESGMEEVRSILS